MNRTRTIASLRVSTADQDVEKNKRDILHLANDKALGKVEWIEEQASGRLSWRKREIARTRAGMKLGRPKGSGSSKLDKHRPEIEALLETGSTQRYIASRFNTTESNLSRWMKKHGLKRTKQ